MHIREALVPVLVVVSAVLCTAPPAGAQILQTVPAESALAGELVRISAEGLRPGERVTLGAERWYAPTSRAPDAPLLFRAEVEVRADAAGTIDMARDASLSGSYTGVDPRGVFWSMTATQIAAAENSPDQSEVRLTLTRSDDAALQARLRLLPSDPAVVVTRIDELPGATFAVPPSDGALPVLIVLGGSEGGALISDSAAWFASHGYAVLALPYFAPDRDVPGLPEGMVEQPIEYLDQAYRWLATQPRADTTRVALHGTSLGATYALLAAVHYDWVDAVVASVPSDVVIDGWGPGIAEGTRSAFSWRGEPMPFVPSIGYDEETQRDEIRVRRVYERGRAANPERAARARIPVERIRGEVMVIGAYDDQMWPSGMMAQNLAERRLELGLRVTARLYPEAGHVLYKTGDEPTTHYHQRRRKVGGTPLADARAQADAWEATWLFLADALEAPAPARR